MIIYHTTPLLYLNMIYKVLSSFAILSKLNHCFRILLKIIAATGSAEYSFFKLKLVLKSKNYKNSGKFVYLGTVVKRKHAKISWKNLCKMTEAVILLK